MAIPDHLKFRADENTEKNLSQPDPAIRPHAQRLRPQELDRPRYTHE
ncbi:hypothetical protein F441_19239 [Phytophthora nicotianae CJ01A1]|uniref:Uncharacterized protein n=2 Tax=Phytophthora nicotianae TaxID=4792 RepID=V9E4W1_PHYNI|nr:hypothetical protein F443_19421 [Phytophthora nicotianae P1569]ETP03867.1 hypothetical protein F441_19239 [Phytophthora nicotianae CJ01A1]